MDLPIPFNIVGMQFAQGNVLIPKMTTESKIALRRNPLNPYDSNAIEVHTLGPFDDGTELTVPSMLGHMPRALAAEVAPEMDRRGLSLCKAQLLMDGANSVTIESWPQWAVSWTADNANNTQYFETREEAEIFAKELALPHTILDPNNSL